jgi:concanavalin A-like lectin/glucanase superfamily protein
MNGSGHRLVRLLAAVLAALPWVECGPAAYKATEVGNHCSIHLDGDDDFLDLGTIAPASALMLAGHPFTLSAWFRQEAGGDPYQRIVDKSDGPLARNGWALAADPGERRIHFYVHDGSKGGDFISSHGAYRTGEWHQVTAVARQDSLEIWIDGKRDGRSSYESGSHRLPADVATTARLGTWNHEPGREFKGWLDEVAIWNTDLSSDAIEAVHAAGGRGDLGSDWGPYRFSQHLVGWWRMEEGAAGTPADRIQDSSGKSISAALMPDFPGGNAARLDCKNVP